MPVCTQLPSTFVVSLALNLSVNRTAANSANDVDQGIVAVLGVIILLLSVVIVFLLLKLHRARATPAVVPFELPESMDTDAGLAQPDEVLPEDTVEEPELPLYGRLVALRGLDVPDIPINYETFTIGRTLEDDCNFAIDKPFISPQHCTIVYRDGEFLIKDLGSKNGTFVNGERLPREREIIVPIGSEIEITKNVAVELWDPNTVVELGRTADANYQQDDGSYGAGELTFQPFLDVVYADGDAEISDDYSPI